MDVLTKFNASSDKDGKALSMSLLAAVSFTLLTAKWGVIISSEY